MASARTIQGTPAGVQQDRQAGESQRGNGVSTVGAWSGGSGRGTGKLRKGGWTMDLDSKG